MFDYDPEVEEIDVEIYDGAPDNPSSQMVDGKQDSDDDEEAPGA